MDDVSAIGIDLRSISELSDHNEEFRQSIIGWTIKYCKSDGRKWGHVRLAKSLIKNAYPEFADNKQLVEEKASPFYETLRKLLYTKKTESYGKVTLSKNRYLFDLMCFFVFNEDLSYFKYQLYGSRIEKVAQSFLHMNKGLNTSNYKKNKNKRSEAIQGLYREMKEGDLFWDIKIWNPGYLQIIRVLQRIGEQGTYYEKDPGVLVEQDFGHVCFLYSEHSRIMSIYRLAGFHMGQSHSRVPDFSVRVLADGSSISFKRHENEIISNTASKLVLQNG